MAESAATKDMLPLPAPEPDGDSQPFWDTLKEGRLIYQRCRACGRAQYYPRAICRWCHAYNQFDWQQSAGLGSVYTYSVVHQAGHPVWRQRVPYCIALVDLDEEFRVTTRVVNADPNVIRVGLRVRAVYESADAGMTLLHFEPAGA
jgi:uncharacterized OB-fold protein